MLNRLIICLTIALAVVPISADYFGPSWKARWILADAANQYDREKVDRAREQLRKAIAMAPDIAMDPNFWALLAKIELSDQKFDGNIQDWIKTLDNIEPEPIRRIVAINAANSLFKERRFDIAVELLDKFLPPASERTHFENNQIAYFRSVEGHDLDIALEEVELSLKKSVNEGNLDTKAWILHEQNSDAEALRYSNQAIQMVNDSLKENATKLYALVETKFNQLLAERSAKASGSSAEEDSEKTDKSEKTESEEALVAAPTKIDLKLIKSAELREEFERQFTTSSSREILKQIAVMRYHRQCILNALAKHDEALKDELWLRAFGFEDPKELF